MSATVTAQALQQALTPKTGMQRIPIPLESYEHASLPLSAKRLINFYAEQEPSDARTAAALIPTPGLVELLTVGTGPSKYINTDLPGFAYVVSGTEFFRVRSDLVGGFIIDMLGDVGTPAAGGTPPFQVTVAVGPTAVVVCVPPNAFTCDHSMTTLNQLSGTFEGATSVAFMDGYFAFTSAVDATKWFICGLMDPTNFDALDFAFSDALPNNIVRVINHRGEFWMMGVSGHEVWYDSGNVDFPFRRRPGAVIRKGVSSSLSIAVGDGSVWWVGVDDIVYRSNGYIPQRVSTHAIESLISADTVTNGMFYIQDGHSFYSATFGNRTCVYDVATGAWHERSSSTDGTAAWRIACASTLPSFLVLGDSVSGKLFRPMLGVTDEDGAAVIRSATLPPLWAQTRRAFCARVEVEMQPLAGETDDIVTLEWSDDGGMTWGPSRALQAGPSTATRKRVFTTRLGSFRQRVFRISSQKWFTLYAIDADVTSGAS